MVSQGAQIQKECTLHRGGVRELGPPTYFKVLWLSWHSFWIWALWKTMFEQLKVFKMAKDIPTWALIAGYDNYMTCEHTAHNLPNLLLLLLI